MKKSIIFCHTPFQCITALMLKSQISNNENEEVSMAIINDFANSYDVFLKFVSLEVFAEVLYGDYSALNSKITFFSSIVFPVFFRKTTRFVAKQYTDVFTNNVNGDFENYILAYNKNARVHLYDEGYSSYLPEYLNGYYKYSLMHNIAYKLSKALYNRKLVSECYADLYLFDQRLLTYKPETTIRKIEMPENYEDFLISVNNVFSISKISEEYSKRFIFFEESFFVDKKEAFDLEGFENIVKYIGKENIIVKLHPRDKENRFAKLQCCTNNQSETPWEAVVLQIPDKNKVFITFSSGAAINYLFFGLEGYKTIFLYEVYPQMGEMTESKRKWFELFKLYYGDNVYIPKTEEELVNILKNI